MAMTTAKAFDTFSELLEAGRVRDGLIYLASLTNYRFVGIWRFQGGKANAAIHFDKEHPTVTSATEVPENATYCCYVRDSRGVFVTAHALLDPRTEGHPAREVVPAYCGVPIMDSEGELLGTLCHYDLVPRDPSELDLELLLQAASAIAQRQMVPAYPGSRP